MGLAYLLDFYRRLQAKKGYRPEVVIFTRAFREDLHALQFRRQRPASVFYRRRGKGQREERKRAKGER